MKIGDVVADFELPDQHGAMWRLGEALERGPVVAFFYPAAMTKGCTAESCHFRDMAAEFAAFSAQRVGISLDPVDKQRQFSEENEFDYPLLADVDGAVARQFGVMRAFRILAVKRETFVIDKDFQVIEIVRSEVRMERHADQALSALRGLTASR